MPDAIQWIGRVIGEGLPAPPAAILEVPAIGQQLYAGWLSLSKQGSALVAHFEAEIKGGVNWLLLETGMLGTFVLEFVMAIVIAGILLAHQDAVATLIHTFVQKTSGAPGLEKLALLVSTTRSVVRGVIGSALVQAVVCTFAYVVAGVPGWPLLGALTCFASIIQIGPILVWLPVAIWLWMQQSTGWAIFVGAWGLLVGNTVDNVVQPYLISKGSNLPMLLTFISALGGFIKWGIIGVFVGPVVLAVAYDMILRWVEGPALVTDDIPAK